MLTLQGRNEITVLSSLPVVEPSRRAFIWGEVVKEPASVYEVNTYYW
jgi:hypothetical protein